MHKIAIATLALIGIGMMLVAAVVGDAAGATVADTEGYAQAIAIHSNLTPAMIVAQEHALFQR